MTQGFFDPDTIDRLDVRAVWRALEGHVVPVTLVSSERLDGAIGSDIRVTLACETFQRTGSFKFRAAMSAALASKAERLLTASSGNFGAALAAAASRTGKACTVVMPDRSAAVKIASVRGYGAQVELIDTDRVSRAERIRALREEDPRAQVVSPFDDPHVIVGNSSLAREIFERAYAIGCIVAPVGGGGLSSGLVVGRDLLLSRAEVVGAEPAIANDAARSLASGTLIANDREPPTLCDGARTLSLGERNFAILQKGLAGIVEVSEASIARAVKLLFDAVNLKAEPTGALSLAALLETPARFAGKRVVCVVSGGNVDAAVYAGLIQRSE